jgi:hypothetical protein
VGRGLGKFPWPLGGLAQRLGKFLPAAWTLPIGFGDVKVYAARKLPTATPTK